MGKQKNNVGVRLQLGYSPLTKTISLARMKDIAPGQRLRVGSEPGRDVSNEAAQLVWQLVMDNGGQIEWLLDDGSRMVLKACRQDQNTGAAGCGTQEGDCV